MFKTFHISMKSLLNDKRGEDLAEVSSGLSKAAKTAIALGVIAATAAGTTTLANNSNSATDTASAKVNAPIGAQAGQTAQSQSVYK